MYYVTFSTRIMAVVHYNGYTAYIVAPNFFCSRGHLFHFGGHGGHKVIFVHFLLSPLFPSLQQLGGLGPGSAGSAPAGSGTELQPTTHFRAFYGKKWSFWHVANDFPAFKETRNFSIFTEISYFHHNGHSCSYSTGLPCQNGKFYSFCTCILKII